MSYISLYRKYRPKDFSDVVGQNIVVKILKNSIIDNKIAHAYIFSGPRGTGKTSIAKIFSRAVNCLDSRDGNLCGQCQNCIQSCADNIDIIEIDAASNNGVDEIREIRNNVKLLPSSLKYKVYIIDEVHMLSTSAFNALLKTLEEPPEHVIFILATTEFNKIPLTVISRCQKFDFKKIEKDDIIFRLKYILDKENKSLPDNIISLIADLSDGGLRDAINLLDQILSLNSNDITEEIVYDLIGNVSNDEIFNFFSFIVNSKYDDSLNLIDTYYRKGLNFITICNKLTSFVKDLLIYNSTDDYFDEEYEKKLSNFSKIDIDKIFALSDELFQLLYELKRSSDQKMIMDIYLLKIMLIFSKNDSKISPNIKKNTHDDINLSVESKNDVISNDFKKIRINNALFGANKKLKNDFIEKFNIINDYIFVKEYNNSANLIIKSNVEVVSDKNIIFTFPNKVNVDLFNSRLDEIESLLKKVYNSKYSVIAVDKNEWNAIKNEYVANIKNGFKYEYISESIEPVVKNSATKLQSSVENIFGDEYISE